MRLFNLKHRDESALLAPLRLTLPVFLVSTHSIAFNVNVFYQFYSVKICLFWLFNFAI